MTEKKTQTFVDPVSPIQKLREQMGLSIGDLVLRTSVAGATIRYGMEGLGRKPHTQNVLKVARELCEDDMVKTAILIDNFWTWRRRYEEGQNRKSAKRSVDGGRKMEAANVSNGGKGLGVRRQ